MIRTGVREGSRETEGGAMTTSFRAIIGRRVLRAGLPVAGMLLALCVGAPDAQAFSKESCSFKGKRLWGKVQVVNSFPDIKVQIVSSFPDVKVQKVTSFPDSCGKWQFVTSFPDIKIQFVTSFPDVKIQYVTSFPGTR